MKPIPAILHQSRAAADAQAAASPGEVVYTVRSLEARPPDDCRGFVSCRPDDVERVEGLIQRFNPKKDFWALW